MTTETTTRVELDLTELESLVANTRNNGDIDLVFGPLFRSCLRELGTDTAELLPELLRRARQLERVEAFLRESLPMCPNCPWPPAEKRGEAPDPLPGVLPVGTRTLGGMSFHTEAALLPGTKHPVYRSADESQYAVADHIDWAHWRATHSPPPSREGEALPSWSVEVDGVTFAREFLVRAGLDTLCVPTDSDLADCLRAMSKERRDRLVAPYVGLREDYITRANVLRGSAEAAEERAARAEREVAALTDIRRVELHAWNVDLVERDEARARVAELEKELEAARARVGTLEAFIRNVTRGDLLDLPHAETVERLQVLRAKSLPNEPTPSAPTPAVVDGYAGKPELWVVEIDELDEDGQPLNEWFVPNREGAEGEGRAFATREKAEAYAASGAEDVPGYRWRVVGYVPTKEPTRRSRGAIIPGIEALAASLPTNPDDEAVVDAMKAKRPVVTRPLVSAPTPAVVDSKQPRAPGCKCHWEEGDSPCPVHGENEESPPRDSGGEVAPRGLAPAAPDSGGEKPSLLKEGGDADAEAVPSEQKHENGRLGGHGVGPPGARFLRRVAAAGDPGATVLADSVAPRDLTPDEAEEGRWLFENIPWNKCSEPAGEWKDALPEERAAWAAAEREAHREGAKAAKAEGALLEKRIDVLRAAVRSLGMGSITRESDARRYLSNDDDMARELGGEK